MTVHLTGCPLSCVIDYVILSCHRYLSSRGERGRGLGWEGRSVGPGYRWSNPAYPRYITFFSLFSVFTLVNNAYYSLCKYIFTCCCTYVHTYIRSSTCFPCVEEVREGACSSSVVPCCCMHAYMHSNLSARDGRCDCSCYPYSRCCSCRGRPLGYMKVGHGVEGRTLHRRFETPNLCFLEPNYSRERKTKDSSYDRGVGVT